MVKNFELFEGERRPFLQVKTYIQMLGLHNIVSLEDDALRFSEHYQYSAGELAKIAILRSLVFLNPTQVQLIRGDPRYCHTRF